MQPIVNMQAVQQPTLRQILGLSAGQQGMGDGFAMIFQQLMSDGESFDALLALTGQNNEKEASELGSQMAAEMLLAGGGLPGIQDPLMLSFQMNSETFSSVAGGQSPLPQMMMEMANTLAVQQQAEMPAEEQVLQQPLTGESFYTVLQNAGKETAQMPELGLAMQADMAVRQAKELIAQEEQLQTVIPMVDVEALQQQVDSGRFMPEQASQQTQQLPMPDAEEIAQQVKAGIAQNVAEGKNEFVVRLQPEGIGEIVVKLSENNEKISLTIFTASSETAKLISNEVMALQNALRPLQAEVEQIVVAPNGQAEEYAGQSQQMMEHGQQSAERQFAEQEQKESYYNAQEDAGFGEMMEETLLASGLRAYF